MIVIGGALSVAVGPIVGVALILGTDAHLARQRRRGRHLPVTMPLVAITTAYVYFDRRVTDELASEDAPTELPAEIEFSS